MHQPVPLESPHDSPLDLALRHALRNALAQELGLAAHLPSSATVPALSLDAWCCVIAHVYVHTVAGNGHPPRPTLAACDAAA